MNGRAQDRGDRCSDHAARNGARRSALAAFGLVADWKYVAEQQRDLVLEIAALLGTLPGRPTEDVAALFLAGAGAAFGGKMVGEAAIRLLAERAARRAFSRVIPGAGAIVAGAVNYAATFAIGARRSPGLRQMRGLEVRGLIPARVHPRMEELRKRCSPLLEPPAPRGASFRISWR